MKKILGIALTLCVIVCYGQNTSSSNQTNLNIISNNQVQSAQINIVFSNNSNTFFGNIQQQARINLNTQRSNNPVQVQRSNNPAQVQNSNTNPSPRVSAPVQQRVVVTNRSSNPQVQNQTNVNDQNFSENNFNPDNNSYNDNNSEKGNFLNEDNEVNIQNDFVQVQNIQTENVQAQTEQAQEWVQQYAVQNKVEVNKINIKVESTTVEVANTRELNLEFPQLSREPKFKKENAGLTKQINRKKTFYRQNETRSKKSAKSKSVKQKGMRVLLDCPKF